MSKVLVINNRPGKLLYACCVYIKDNIFIIFADNMMKLSVNKAVVDFNINTSPLSKVKPNFKKNCLVYELVTSACKIMRHLCMGSSHDNVQNDTVNNLYATCTSLIMHLICPPKFCVTFVFHFSWALQPSQEKLKNDADAKFLWANKAHYGRCASGV